MYCTNDNSCDYKRKIDDVLHCRLSEDAVCQYRVVSKPTKVYTFETSKEPKKVVIAKRLELLLKLIIILFVLVIYIICMINNLYTLSNIISILYIIFSISYISIKKH